MPDFLCATKLWNAFRTNAVLLFKTRIPIICWKFFSQKLKAYGKLSEKDQEQLNLTHKQILKEKVLPAYQTLIEGLEQLRGTGKKYRRTGQFFR